MIPVRSKQRLNTKPSTISWVLISLQLNIHSSKETPTPKDFIAHSKEEVILDRDFDIFDEVVKSVEEFIEFYYNHYPHSALGYIIPVDFEKQNNYSNLA